MDTLLSQQLTTVDAALLADPAAAGMAAAMIRNRLNVGDAPPVVVYVHHHDDHERDAARAWVMDNGLARYLGSGLGSALAGRIVARFGLEALAVLDDGIDRLLEVPGIGPKKLEKIKPAWAEQRKVAALMASLMELGVGPALAARIYKEYGDEAEQVVI